MTMTEEPKPRFPIDVNNPPPTPPKAVGKTLVNDIKLTPKAQEQICAALASNQTMAVAAALVGVRTTTVYDWMRRGNNGEEPFASFVNAIEQAIAQGQGRLVKKIDDSANQGNTADAKWLLERRYPNEWGKKDKVEIGGDPNQPITVQLTWPGQGGDQDSEVVTATHEKTLALPDTSDEADDVVDAEVVEDGLDQQTA